MRTASNPLGARGHVVLVDVSPRRSRCAAGPGASARSVPGVGCRCRSACLAVAVTPRVDDDEPRRPRSRIAVEVADERRHGLGHVAADEQDRVGAGEVGDREGQAAVHAEGAVGGRGGRGHAEPAVVVDLAGPQRHPGELAELVGLLVGEPAAAEHGDARRGRARPGRARIRSATGRAPRPSRAGLGRTGAGVVSRSAAGQQLAGGPALLAQAARVGRDVLAAG